MRLLSNIGGWVRSESEFSSTVVGCIMKIFELITSRVLM